MSTISNRFYITALEDGSTLHGNLASDKSLTQMWTGSSAVPNWEEEINQPEIYLTLLDGSTLVAPNSFKWYYNNQEIEFSYEEDGTISNDGKSTNGLFQQTKKIVQYGTSTKEMPALKIIGNLAGYGGNVDIDTISINGTYSVDGSAGISFASTIQVRISEMTANGYLGVINFKDGIADITEKGQSILMYAVLYDSSGSPASEQYTTRWYLNEETSYTTGTTIDGFRNAFSVTEEKVIDHAIVRCEFWSGNDRRATAYVGIDDMQDPQYMYIQYNGANGNAASLRSGEDVEFNIWIGTRTDASVDTSWRTFKLQLLDGNGNIIKDNGLSTDIPNVDSGDVNGYRTLMVHTSGENINKAYVTPHYDTVNHYGKNLTGIIIAYKNE